MQLMRSSSTAQGTGPIYTLGTGNRTAADFFSILRRYAIDTLIDVRRHPQDDPSPHFNRDGLEASLTRAEIHYRWLGSLLGGVRFGGYGKHRRTVSYQKGLQMVERLARQGPTVLVCAEKMPWKCHRYDIAEDLVARGWRVVHLLDLNDSRPH